MTDLRIGTSGWHYRHWVGRFYPSGMKSAEMLAYYFERFNTVEINNSFYRLPPPETFASWKEQTPADFRFAVKGSRYLTHMKKLKEPDEAIARLHTSVKELGKKLGVVLFQLPPHWRLNLERFESFLKALPKKTRYAFEFREPSWLDARVYKLLERHNAAFCIYELAGFHTPIRVTADFTYIRLHGPTLAKYQGSYSDAVLRNWARRIEEWKQSMEAVYVYFDNDEAAHAIDNALTLKKLTGDRPR
jgi:uncharacterized protein YecE (DUF72 family)